MRCGDTTDSSWPAAAGVVAPGVPTEWRAPEITAENPVVACDGLVTRNCEGKRRRKEKGEEKKKQADFVMSFDPLAKYLDSLVLENRKVQAPN
jgi:hypothetical protein